MTKPPTLTAIVKFKSTAQLDTMDYPLLTVEIPLQAILIDDASSCYSYVSEQIPGLLVFHASFNELIKQLGHCIPVLLEKNQGLKCLDLSIRVDTEPTFVKL